MSPFEFVTVLISIILGLGITQILIGLSELIRRGKGITFHWPYAIWILLVFVMHVREWWRTYALKSIDQWYLLYFLFAALYPIILFVLANLLFPQNWPRKHFDMPRFYRKNWRLLFKVVLLLAVVSVLQNTFMDHMPLSGSIPEMVLMASIILMLIVATENSAVHLIYALLLLTGLLASLVVERNILIIGS